MAYFVRTVESIEEAHEALKRGRSVRRWNFAGGTPYDIFMYGIPVEEQREALKELAELDPESYGDYANVDEWTDEEVRDAVLYDDIPAEDIIKVLNLEPFDDRGGYAQYLPGLCALEQFEQEPKPEDVTATLHGELFAYLVCYEGEFVGYDPDEGWPLFKPTRIVWIHETGSTTKRWREF